jgi:hypothetical protein
MIIVAICEVMGWDYYTYQAQPIWFTELLIRKLEIDSKKQQAAINKSRGRTGVQ